ERVRPRHASGAASLMSAMPQGGQGLGGLLAGGGQPNPDDLLAQIRDLLDQYLALGDSTPVAAEAQNLADAIDQTAGGAAPPEGGPPAPGGDENEPQVPAENQMGAGDITQS